MISSISNNILFTVFALCTVFPMTLTGQNPPIPTEYQPQYTLAQTNLQLFNATLTAAGNPPAYTGSQCGSLYAADSNAGPSLLNSDPYQQLNELIALGVPCIEVHVSFPLLYEPFMTSQGQSMSAFETFYSTLANQIRAAGKKLMVESTVLFTSAMSSEAGWDTAPFYATLDWTEYQAARATTALTIAQTMQPDYMVVLEEPDTEAENTGQTNVDTSSGANSLLATILANMQTERQTGMQIGAGVGTWLPGFQPFIQGFVAQPMDFIDFHIYPDNDSFLPNALTIASMAAHAHMPVSCTECWLNKELDSELNVLTPDEIGSRNVFSFWAPLDQYFVQTMGTMASYIQIMYGNTFLFFTPYESNFFFVYQTYDSTTETESPQTLLSTESSDVVQANESAQYSVTGSWFYNTLVTTPDHTPPTPPPNVTAVSDNPTTAFLTWNESTDDVGVAGYNLYRDGTQIATTSALEPGVTPYTYYYQDTGLTEATNYTYKIVAFDMAGNKSQPSQPVTVQTTNITPPTTPTNLVASAPGCTRVQLTWDASTDNIGVNQYLIFMGLSPGAMQQIASAAPKSSPSYNDQNVNAATTYYFAVEATDKDGNVSLMSNKVRVTTPALPTAPTNVQATADSATRVTLTWNPSTGGLPIAHYNVYKGSSADTLVETASTTGTSYNDTNDTPATKYCYAVQAADSGSPNSTSGLSAVVCVDTYAMPGPPTNVTAVPDSTSRITLSWTAPTGGLPIANYKVFRGLTPTGLTQLTTVLKSPYNDQTVEPNTTYYYALEAVDTGTPPDTGAMSTPVPAKTYGDPGAPTNVVATPESSSKITITWTASVPNGLAISNYHVYGGATCASMAQLGVTTGLTYNNTSLATDSTHCYAVQAVDSGGDDSAMSADATATTYPLPTTPTNVTATGESTTMMAVSWSPSTGGLPIKYYYVYRGTTPTNLSQVAITTNPSYTDKDLSAGTTYYYSIQADDTAGDQSGSSAPVAGTTKP